MSPRFPTPGMSVRNTTFTAHPPRPRWRQAPVARAPRPRARLRAGGGSVPPAPAPPAAHAASAGPLACRPLGERKKRQFPSSLDCQSNLTLVLGTVARHPPGTNLAPIGHELAQQVHVFVVDPSGVLLAEDADLLLRAPTSLLRNAP